MLFSTDILLAAAMDFLPLTFGRSPADISEIRCTPDHPPSSLPSLLGLPSFSSRFDALSSSWIADIRDGAKLVPRIPIDFVLRRSVQSRKSKFNPPFLPQSIF